MMQTMRRASRQSRSPGRPPTAPTPRHHPFAALIKAINVASQDRQKDCSILVVEDHSLLQFSIVTWLEHRFPACTVLGVESGEKALERVRTARPDVVLMDINLRGMDGIEATYRIKALAPDIAVVALSTHDTPYHRVAAANAGAARYVAKRDMDTELEPAISGLLPSRAGSPGTRATPAVQGTNKRRKP